MSDYRINLGSVMYPVETDKLYDLLGILNEDDELVISMDSSKSYQTDTIYNVLQANDFDITTTGAPQGDGMYSIIARRRR